MEEQRTNLRGVVVGVLAIAACAGLAGGLLEGTTFLALQAAGWLSWGRRLWAVDYNILWASTMVDVILFLTIACLLLPAFLALRRHRWHQVATAVFATMTFYALLSVSGRLRERSVVLLAMGLGVVLSRRLGSDPLRLMAWLRRALALFAILALLGGVGAVAGGQLWEQRQLARLSVPEAGAPDVLLIVLDTLRGDRLSSYGYNRPTSPFLDEYAGLGVRFENAFANASWTPPSHASMFTGRLPNEHGVSYTPLGKNYPTLAEVLAESGYATAGFVANRLGCSKAYGLARGFQRWENLFTSPADAVQRTVYWRTLSRHLYRYIEYDGSLGQMRAEEINRRFLNWLDGRPARPFFAFLNYMEMHTPYTPPLEFAARFCEHPEEISSRNLFKLRSLKQAPDPTERNKRSNDAYDASLAYLDAQLKVLFSELRSRGLEENLVVIITSDHGESLGDHNLEGHRTSLYREQIHVPLLIRYPKRTRPSHVVSLPVSLHALPATILDLAGSDAARFPVVSLAPLCRGETIELEPVLSEVDGSPRASPQSWPITQGWVKSLVTSEWHLLWQQNGKIELYDWKNDPLELHDLALTSEGKPVAQALLGKLKQLMENGQQARPVPAK